MTCWFKFIDLYKRQIFETNYLFIYFQRQDDYEYDESADYGEQDESEAALGLPADSSSIRENIGQAHHTCFHDSWIHESTIFFTILFFL